MRSPIRNIYNIHFMLLRLHHSITSLLSCSLSLNSPSYISISLTSYFPIWILFFLFNIFHFYISSGTWIFQKYVILRWIISFKLEKATTTNSTHKKPSIIIWKRNNKCITGCCRGKTHTEKWLLENNIKIYKTEICIKI